MILKQGPRVLLPLPLSLPDQDPQPPSADLSRATTCRGEKVTVTKNRKRREYEKYPHNSHEPPTEKSVTTPETPGHDDDPDRIDDVV